MSQKISRSIKEPIRGQLTWQETWDGADQGLIKCWETGRLKAETDPEIAAKAKAGELVMLVWQGGVDGDQLQVEPTKRKAAKEYGTFNYLAMWQGLRGQDLDIDLEKKYPIECSKTGRTVVFDSRSCLNAKLKE